MQSEDQALVRAAKKQKQEAEEEKQQADMSSRVQPLVLLQPASCPTALQILHLF